MSPRGETMERSRSASLLRWGWGVVLVAFSGVACSGSGSGGQNPVQGKVLYRNQPLSGALVTFHTSDSDALGVVRPTGLTKEDGTFTLTTGDKAGALAGNYVVTIICTETSQSAKKKALSTGDDTEIVDRLRGVYAERSASRIKVEVKKGENKLEPFDLK